MSWFYLVLCSLLAVVPVTGKGEPVGDVPVAALPPAEDFIADAQRSARDGIPILVAVTRDECGYCLKLKQAVLVPMLRSGNYENQVIMRELNVDWQAQVTGFDGRRVFAAAWAQRYRVGFTPTVLLLDPGGREVAERLVGVNTIEMYGWYLDQAIAAATAKIKGRGDE